MLQLILQFILLVSPSPALEGKWLAVVDGDTYTVPAILIMEFSNGQMTQYDFKTKTFSGPFQMRGQRLIFNGRQHSRIQMESDGSFFLKSGRAKMKFVKLLPTKTKMTVDEIESRSYRLQWNRESVRINFGNKKAADWTEGFKTKFAIEQIDGTFLIGLYERGVLRKLIPIAEARHDYLELYGFPSEPFKVRALTD